MAKTVLHKELKEKKKERNSEIKEKYGINLNKRAKIVIGCLCAVLVITPIAIHLGGKQNKPTKDPSTELVNVDDKYVVDSNGEVTFLNGDEVAKSIGEIYSTKVSTTYEGGSSDFTVEVDMRNGSYIEYYYGNKNDTVFNEAIVTTITSSMFLTNSNNQFVPADSVTYANIDGKRLVESVLCGEGLTEKDNVFTSKVALSNISGVFPEELIMEYFRQIREKNDGEIPSDVLSTLIDVTMAYNNGVITISASCVFGTVNVEIKNIETMSYDFSQFIQ